MKTKAAQLRSNRPWNIQSQDEEQKLFHLIQWRSSNLHFHL